MMLQITNENEKVGQNKLIVLVQQLYVLHWSQFSDRSTQHTQALTAIEQSQRKGLKALHARNLGVALPPALAAAAVGEGNHCQDTYKASRTQHLRLRQATRALT